MRTKHAIAALAAAVVLGIPTFGFAAAHITDFDSTQPRGFGGSLDIYHPNACASGPVYNDQGQDLCPIIEGLWSPFYYVANGGQGSQDRFFYAWKGMTMGNAARDPAFFATLSVANKDFTNLIYAAANKGVDTDNNDLYNLVGLSTARQVACYLKIYEPSSPDPCTPGNPITLLPEDKIPVTADLCLRCHFTAGWLEGRSEPASPHFPYLRGQFWGSKFQEYPGWPGSPQLVDINKDSEADMEGIQCAYCHRQVDNYKRKSQYDNSTMANGNGGYFMNKYDPFSNYLIRPTSNFQTDSIICGTCHDVTNPLVFTKTAVSPSKMLHPIERTYTEWYWSDYGNRTKCVNCHTKMEFPGAQTWLLYPGLDRLWGAVDQKWTQSPYNYTSSVITPYRTQAYMDAKARSEALMESAGKILIEVVNVSVANGYATVDVKVTNNTGHKLPTGFAEGRQMWIRLKAVDSKGNVLFEDGVIDSSGKLVRTANTKVYEQIVLAKGYENFKLNNYSIIDADKDGTVSHYEKEFHFVLMNYIEKDNRIPPLGFNKDAYMADGAFIVPFDAKDTDYPSGQNWDVTTYTIPLAGARGSITVTAELKYQTFNKEYIEFLDTMDTEKTEEFGGRARNVPCNTGSMYCGYQTWGDVLRQIWMDTGKGPAVLMNTASKTFRP